MIALPYSSSTEILRLMGLFFSMEHFLSSSSLSSYTLILTAPIAILYLPGAYISGLPLEDGITCLECDSGLSKQLATITKQSHQIMRGWKEQWKNDGKN